MLDMVLCIVHICFVYMFWIYVINIYFANMLLMCVLWICYGDMLWIYVMNIYFANMFCGYEDIPTVSWTIFFSNDMSNPNFNMFLVLAFTSLNSRTRWPWSCKFTLWQASGPAVLWKLCVPPITTCSQKCTKEWGIILSLSRNKGVLSCRHLGHYQLIELRLSWRLSSRAHGGV